uniref:Uncharacterized protein n=1 Tax=Rhizophora mucronata TaxID=61149 RepID=A0A2P2K681_RHIMU
MMMSHQSLRLKKELRRKLIMLTKTFLGNPLKLRMEESKNQWTDLVKHRNI